MTQGDKSGDNLSIILRKRQLGFYCIMGLSPRNEGKQSSPKSAVFRSSFSKGGSTLEKIVRTVAEVSKVLNTYQ